MKGDEINRLCKTMIAFNQTYIPMTDTIDVINDDHTMICSVERVVFGTPLFDVVNDRCIDVKSVKLNSKDDYKISVNKDIVSFTTDTSIYSYQTVQNDFKPIKDYGFNPTLIIDDVLAKDLLKAVKDGKKNNDWVRVMYDNKTQKLYISNEYDDNTFITNVRASFGDNSIPTLENDFSSVFATEYLIKVLSCVPTKTKLTIVLDNDYPIKIAWNTDEFRYCVLIAPRVEN